MPFCSQCGNQVEPAASFCGRCGARQPGAPAGASGQPRPGIEALGGISPKTASILCYVPGIGWVASIIVLSAEKFRKNRDVRFHAFQGLYLFVAWLINDWVLRSIWTFSHINIHGLVSAVLIVMAIFMMVKASREEAYALPLFGELAARSVDEAH